jgi:glycosidase
MTTMPNGSARARPPMGSRRCAAATALTALLIAGLCACTQAATPSTAPQSAAKTAPAPAVPAFADRLPQDEIIYFLLPDRFENGDPANDMGGLTGDRLQTGFDPAAKGFFNGGDLKGLTARLDYLQELGVTALWLAPVFQNKPVQGPPGQESAGYHGYWVTDFTRVDSHFGTNEDFAALVAEAHARGMKVYMDIITNHTADVIKYRECEAKLAAEPALLDLACPYRGRADYPFTTVGGVGGEPINTGFLGDDREFLTAENYARLTDPRWAYTPFIPAGEEDVKRPAWLNDIMAYSNRGNSEWEGESSLSGDFSGLDDVMLENPVVMDGMIEIYADWIRRYKIDGFRIDTVKHVRWDLWRRLAPALMDVARAEGVPHFHMFAEVYDFDPAFLARFTVEDDFPTTLDFAFQGAVRAVVAEGKPARLLEDLFIRDAIYRGGREGAMQLPTFLGNHDMGRFSQFLEAARPDISDAEAQARVKLAHAIMMFARGVPVIYYGDEQGFVSDGGDQLARETLFPSQVAVYNDNDLIGTDATTADNNFDTNHPLFRAFREMADIRKAHPALRRGLQGVRHSDKAGGLLVLSRRDPQSGAEYLIAFNADTQARSQNVTVSGASTRFASVRGECAPTAQAAASYALSVPALDYVICRALPEGE